MNIRKSLIDSSRYSLKCPYSMKVEYVTYHNTDNNASADAEVRNVKRPDNNDKVSFHIAVDEKEAVKVIPFDRNAFAAGDGKDGPGNRKSIHVEICRNELGANNPTFKKCEDNAAEVCAQLLKENGLDIDRLKPHKYWSGKNCPSTTNHKDFERRVKDKLNHLNGNYSVSNFNTNKIFKNGDFTGRVAIVKPSMGVNIRYDRGTNYKVISSVPKGTVLKLNWCQDEWISVEGYKGNKGLGYVYTKNLELI